MESRSLSFTSDRTLVGKLSKKNSQVQDLSDSSSLMGSGAMTWALPIEDVEKLFGTSKSGGLTKDQAQKSLSENGPNQLEDSSGFSKKAIVLRQTCNAMVIVLIICMDISFGIRDWIAGGVIGGVFIINVVVGCIQEFKAEKTMQSLRSLASPTARVIRNGENEVLSSSEVVPGDLVSLKVGDTVPADLRLVTSMNFETDEACLTGESLPVSKDHLLVLPDDTSVGDRINLAYSSTMVTKGRATGIVIATGMTTEIGKIAKALQDNGKKSSSSRCKEKTINETADPNDKSGEEKSSIIDTIHGYAVYVKEVLGAFLGLTVGTPLHRLLSKLAISLFFVAVLLAIICMAAQKFDVNREVAVYAICVALSMIPASLVVVLTITMAMGTRAMVKRHVIVRKLDSLEALGAVNDICTDKTGTLTQGKMVARKAWCPGLNSEDEPNDVGALTKSLVESNSLLTKFITCAAFCNTAVVRRDEVSGEWKTNGDPTEVAVQMFVKSLGYDKNDVCMDKENNIVPKNPLYTQEAEFPFDSSIKRMSTVYRKIGKDGNSSDDLMVFTKGAVERIVGICNTWYGNGDSNLIDFGQSDHKYVFEKVENLASQGLRVLAFASKNLKASAISTDRLATESSLTFLGVIGIYDPPRPESAAAVAECHRAGINVHMLTGDHHGTATAIAKEVGILPLHPTKSMVYTASEFDQLTDQQIDDLPILPLVIARCSPQTKVRMVEALHRRKAFTAMTGDGVNDSPSLKKANVGIAMGISGSDVAKDASDIVLTDDNFASIANAVEEGRKMTDNIQKFALHLLSGNVSQCVFLMIALAFKGDDGYSVFPLSPVEVLWIIMVTSSFPAMGLGVEQADEGIMDKPPKDPRKAIFTVEVLSDMMFYGLWLALVCLLSFVGYAVLSGDLGYGCNESYNESCKDVFKARSLGFVEMTWCLLFLAWEVVDLRRSPFLMPRRIWQNKFLFYSVIIGFFSVFPTVYIPVINEDVFKHSPITWEWGVAVAGVVVFIAGAELYKYIKRAIFRRIENKNKTSVEFDNV